MSEQLTGWRTLNGAGAVDRLVLAVNFDAGRGVSGFGDLAANLADHRVLECLPAYAHDVTALSAEVQPAGRTGVCGVLGYCAGAPVALALAERFGDPPVVVFDPIAVDAATLVAEYTAAIGPLSDRLGDDERSAATDVTAGAGGTGDLAALANLLDAAYRRALRAACGRLRVAAAVEEQLAERFSRYLRYLVNAAGCRSAAAPAAVALSRSHVAPAASGATHRRFDVAADRLLADEGVASFVKDHIGASTR
jgi:hypothetical protein